MAVSDLPVAARTSTLHCSGRSLCAISLNKSYLSQLKSDRPETYCIRCRSIENIDFKPKNIKKKNACLTPSILPFSCKTYSFLSVILKKSFIPIIFLKILIGIIVR